MARTVLPLTPRIATLGAFASLAVQALWVTVCIGIAQIMPSGNWLVGGLGLMMAGVVLSTLALIGTGLALMVVTGPGRNAWAVLAFLLNALVLVTTTVPLILFVGPTR
jgi:hypothetical protein